MFWYVCTACASLRNLRSWYVPKPPDLTFHTGTCPRATAAGSAVIISRIQVRLIVVSEGGEVIKLHKEGSLMIPTTGIKRV